MQYRGQQVVGVGESVAISIAIAHVTGDFALDVRSVAELDLDDDAAKLGMIE